MVEQHQGEYANNFLLLRQKNENVYTLCALSNGNELEIADYGKVENKRRQDIWQRQHVYSQMCTHYYTSFSVYDAWVRMNLSNMKKGTRGRGAPVYYLDEFIPLRVTSECQASSLKSLVRIEIKSATHDNKRKLIVNGRTKTVSTSCNERIAKDIVHVYVNNASGLIEKVELNSFGDVSEASSAQEKLNSLMNYPVHVHKGDECVYFKNNAKHQCNYTNCTEQLVQIQKTLAPTFSFDPIPPERAQVLAPLQWIATSSLESFLPAENSLQTTTGETTLKGKECSTNSEPISKNDFIKQVRETLKLQAASSEEPKLGKLMRTTTVSYKSNVPNDIKGTIIDNEIECIDVYAKKISITWKENVDMDTALERTQKFAATGSIDGKVKGFPANTFDLWYTEHIWFKLRSGSTNDIDDDIVVDIQQFRVDKAVFHNHSLVRKNMTIPEVQACIMKVDNDYWMYQKTLSSDQVDLLIQFCESTGKSYILYQEDQTLRRLYSLFVLAHMAAQSKKEHREGDQKKLIFVNSTEHELQVLRDMAPHYPFGNIINDCDITLNTEAELTIKYETNTIKPNKRYIVSSISEDLGKSIPKSDGVLVSDRFSIQKTPSTVCIIKVNQNITETECTFLTTQSGSTLENSSLTKCIKEKVVHISSNFRKEDQTILHILDEQKQILPDFNSDRITPMTVREMKQRNLPLQCACFISLVPVKKELQKAYAILLSNNSSTKEIPIFWVFIDISGTCYVKDIEGIGGVHAVEVKSPAPATGASAAAATTLTPAPQTTPPAPRTLDQHAAQSAPSASIADYLRWGTASATRNF